MTRIHLSDAALLDKQRAADLARNDVLMGASFATAYGVKHTRPIVARGVHFNAANDAGPDCKACTVCGGDAQPGDSKLCDSCRSLARVFAASEARQ